jgi:hypothetical protein
MWRGRTGHRAGHRLLVSASSASPISHWVSWKIVVEEW